MKEYSLLENNSASNYEDYIHSSEYRNFLPVLSELNSEVKKIENDIRSMPILEYIDNFLTLHTGYYSPEDKYNMEDWINFAGSPYMEVNLVNDNNEVVAVVPSIYPKNTFIIKDNIGESRNNSIGSKLLYIDSIKDNYRTASEKMKGELFNDISGFISNDNIEEHRKKWRDFFNKMGLSSENIKKYLNDLIDDSDNNIHNNVNKNEEDNDSSDDDIENPNPFIFAE